MPRPQEQQVVWLCQVLLSPQERQVCPSMMSLHYSWMTAHHSYRNHGRKKNTWLSNQYQQAQKGILVITGLHLPLHWAVIMVLVMADLLEPWSVQAKFRFLPPISTRTLNWAWASGLILFWSWIWITLFLPPLFIIPSSRIWIPHLGEFEMILLSHAYAFIIFECRNVFVRDGVLIVWHYIVSLVLPVPAGVVDMSHSVLVCSSYGFHWKMKFCFLYFDNRINELILKLLQLLRSYEM